MNRYISLITFLLSILISMTLMTTVIISRADETVLGKQKENVIKDIESYIKYDSDLKGGFLIYNKYNNTDLNLKYDHVHKSVKRTDNGDYVACVDFNDKEGNVYDLDFYLKENGKDLMINDIKFHKKNGIEFKQ